MYVPAGMTRPPSFTSRLLFRKVPSPAVGISRMDSCTLTWTALRKALRTR